MNDVSALSLMTYVVHWPTNAAVANAYVTRSFFMDMYGDLLGFLILCITYNLPSYV